MPRLGSDHGSAAAELAIALPAVVAVLGLCLGGVGLGATALRAQDAAADAARLLARGDDAAEAAARVRADVSGAIVRRQDRGDLVCATVAASGRGVLAGIRIAATSCALGGGR